MGFRLGYSLGCLLLLWTLFIPPTVAQDQCATPLSFTSVSQPNLIEWSKFPNFTLPFPIIYSGPRFSDQQASPLRHGFSHLTSIKTSELGSFATNRQRAIIYYGFATGLNQPWETLESPWNNDLNAYRAKWDQFLSDISGGQKNASGQYIIQADRLALDIERIRETDSRILQLKQDPGVPATYRQLTDANFVAAYKTAMRNLYAEGIRYVRQHADLSGVTVSSYADTPILNTYLNVIGNTWADWTTNITRVNYLVKDSTEQKIGGPYYDQLDILHPSAYYYYDYPNPFAQNYLSYLLFQIEVNRAWSTKPIVPWVWLRYHDSSISYPNFIQPFMAEATAIFPFFSGAAGLWLWENPSFEQTRTDNYATYEYFIHGLYRLSRFADMFQGTHELVIETPARDLMDRKLPVWRGVVKDKYILIAAQNPYAADGQKTTLTVGYKNWQKIIELTGREVYLCRFDMSVVTANEPSVQPISLFPNPASTEFTVTFPQTPSAETRLDLITVQGQLVSSRLLTKKTETISTSQLLSGFYIVRIQQNDRIDTRKILITQ